MITTPITTQQFQSSVRAILSSYFAELNEALDAVDVPVPLIPPLKPTDTTLLPTESLTHCIGVTSSWIDLASADPAISNVSRQILNLELAYATFCGISNVIIKAPDVSASRGNSSLITQFARAILEALSIGPYVRIHILFPMSPGKGKRTEDSSDLSQLSQVKEEGDDNINAALEPWGPWEAWDIVRSVCKYESRLSVGM